MELGWVKPQGKIIKISDYKLADKQRTQLQNSQNVVLNLATISSDNTSFRMPGQIKTTNKPISKIDQQVYYNADVYKAAGKQMQRIEFESAQLIPIPITQPVPITQQSKITLYAIEQQSVQKMMNVHGQFDLQQYTKLSTLLLNMKRRYSQNQVQFISLCKQYIQFVSTNRRVSVIRQIKMVQNKKQTIRQCFLLQRQSVLAICLTIATHKQQYRSHCINLLTYTYQNYLLILNHLSHQTHPFVLKLIRQYQNNYLIDKGFDLLRNNKQIITDLITKILKSDSLFAAQYYKIVENTANQQIDFIFNALLTFFTFFLHALKIQHTLPFLACAVAPYLLQQPAQQYTLVIDFVRVFTDSKQSKGKNVLLRPYSEYFIKQMAKYYQIVSFSNFMPTQCNHIINSVDQTGLVKNRLYKYHYYEGRRELTRIGRQTDKMIVIDTVQDQQNKHLMVLSSWKGQSSNAQLAEISPLLAQIVVRRWSVVLALSKIRERVRKMGIGMKYINCGLGL